MTMEPEYLGDEDDELEGEEEAEIPASVDHPVCPRCGWSNTRLSHTKTPLDIVLQLISVHSFRCRSCNQRFRKMQRR